MKIISKLNIFWVFLLNLLLLFWIFYFLEIKYEREDIWSNNIREKNLKYTFITPLLECWYELKYYNPNRIINHIDDYINISLANNNIKRVGYYFRFLNNGATFGYNENESFIPASLLKIPIAMGIFKKLEDDKDFLNTSILLNDYEYKPNERYFWQDDIILWNSYTIYQLLVSMLQNSDNLATITLFDYLPIEYFYSIYSDLWLDKVDFNIPETIRVSPKKYSSFLRILYNSSYLNREHSEEILSILSKSTFTNWIRSAIPNDILVVNKFWEKEYEESNLKYLHDCGIVYYTNNPFLLCIMTEGENYDKQVQVITGITRIIYDFVKNN